MYSFGQVSKIICLAILATPGIAGNLRTASPQMGWNSYNHYVCDITQDLIVGNAESLVKMGLHKLGYSYVTPDCGWFSGTRDESGALEWNTTRFPGGGEALGDAIHKLGLKFGIYSDAGYWQCGGLNKYPGSVGYEQQDANAFSRWGVDSLKYDNCYNAPNTTVGADFHSIISGSPDRFRAMATALSNIDRDILYQLCQWGVGEYLGSWGAAIANSWRISVDIYHNWGSIWRITNQVIPFAKYVGPGAYPDMDMLIVGLGALSEQEEITHFSLWSIFKSPMILGNSISEPIGNASFNVISNKEVIALNQDALGKSAELVRRYSEEGYDIYAGPLTNGRMVFAVTNWVNSSQTVEVNITDVLGVSSARARDVWAHKDMGRISETYSVELLGHGTVLLVLSDIKYPEKVHKTTSYYIAAQAEISGNATTVDCGTGLCLPTESKVTNIGSGHSGAVVKFINIVAEVGGTKLLELDYINYDIAWESSWKRPEGRSSRNLTISVNSGAEKRWELPISGGSWFETGRLGLEVDGFQTGNNTVEFRAVDGLIGFAPDIVGFSLIE